MLSTLEKSISKISLVDMQMAVKIIVNAMKNKEKIVVVGDYDVDGMSATALVFLAFKRHFNYRKIYFISNNRKYGNGVNDEMVRRITDMKDIDLVITVDHGSKDEKSYKKLKEVLPNLKIIVTDHHTTYTNEDNINGYDNGKPLSCDAFINPHRPGSKNGDELSGCFVAYIVMSYVAKALGKDKYLKSLTPLVALTIISDVMNVKTDYNAIMYKIGLYYMMVNRDLWLSIRRVLKLNYTLTSDDIGYKLSPLLNSAGRLGEAEAGVKLLIANSRDRIDNQISYVMNLNKLRKQITTGFMTEAKSRLKLYKSRHKHGNVIVLDNAAAGINGIISGVFAERHKTPTVVLTENIDTYSGSCRAIPGYNLLDTFETMELKDETMFKKYGGHTMACGITIWKDKLADFLKDFSATVGEKLKDFKFVDASIAKVVDLNATPEEQFKTYMEYIKDSPYGKGNRSESYMAFVTINGFFNAGTHKILKTNVGKLFFLNGGDTPIRLGKAKVYGSLSMTRDGLEILVKDVENIK